MMQKELVLGLPTVNIEKKSMWIVSSWEKESPSLSKGNIILSCFDIGATTRRLFGPVIPSTQAGNKYVFVVIDDHRRYMWTML